MKVLDLFSGIGGFSLGLERAGFETVAFCEIDPFCRKVLNKHWPDIPIHEDITKLDGTQYRGTVELVCGGFPCQPFSQAGKRAGKEDDRALWPEMLRVIRNVEPQWVVGENVAGFIGMGLDDCLSDLEDAGYITETFLIPACAVGASHRRDRIWIAGRCGNPERGRFTARAFTHANSAILQRGEIDTEERCAFSGEQQLSRLLPISSWAEISKYQNDGETHGVPNRVDRIRALGNAVVPQIPEIIGRAIMEITT